MTYEELEASGIIEKVSLSEEEIKARVSLHLNTIDLLLYTEFCPQCYFAMQPFVGLKTAWIDQRFSINANGGSSLGPPFTFVVDDAISMENNFWGIGPKMGVDATWPILCGFSLIGNVDFSILYGQFTITQNENVLFSNEAEPTTYLDITDNKFTLSRINIGLLLGLRWEKSFYCNRYHFYLESAWENQYFLGQNQLMRFTDDQNPGTNVAVQGDLTIQGLTITAGLSF